jgi:hypothetical protein
MDNNPIRYSDFLGDTLDFPGATPEFVLYFKLATDHLVKKGVGGLFNEAKKAKETIHVVQAGEDDISEYDPETNTLSWNPLGGASLENAITSPATVLNHELDHGVHEVKNPEENKKLRETPDKNYTNKEEARVIKGSEQKTAVALGEIPKGTPTRTNHKGALYHTTSPTSTQGVHEKIEQQLIEKMQREQREKEKKKSGQ